MHPWGRKPQGVGLVAPLQGSEHAKQRLTCFLQTLAGQCSVGAACAVLEIGESRFHDQRHAWLQAALALLEPHAPGRPPKLDSPVPPEEVRMLRQRVRDLEARAAAVEVQGELARSLPHLVGRAGPGKKTSARRRRPADRGSRRAGPKPPTCP